MTQLKRDCAGFVVPAPLACFGLRDQRRSGMPGDVRQRGHGPFHIAPSCAGLATTDTQLIAQVHPAYVNLC